MGTVGRYFRIVGMGFSGVFANPVRALLTMLGIIIGVGAVIMLTSLGNGIQESITGEIEGLGTNLIQVSPGSEAAGGDPFGAAPASTLTLQDAENIGELDSVNQASATATAVTQLQTGESANESSGNPASDVQQDQPAGIPRSPGQAYTGVNPSYDEIVPVDLAAGRFIQSGGEAVLGESLVEDELDAGPEEALGRTVEIGGRSLEVVGGLGRAGGR